MELIDVLESSVRRTKYIPAAARHAAAQEAGFMVCDSRGKVLLCSPLAAEIHGATPAELEGLTLDELLQPRSNAKRRTPVDLAKLSGQSKWRRLSLTNENGHPIEVDASATKFEIDQSPFFILRLRRADEI